MDHWNVGGVVCDAAVNRVHIGSRGLVRLAYTGFDFGKKIGSQSSVLHKEGKYNISARLSGEKYNISYRSILRVCVCTLRKDPRYIIHIYKSRARNTVRRL